MNKDDWLEKIYTAISYYIGDIASDDDLSEKEKEQLKNMLYDFLGAIENFDEYEQEEE
ncbi:hypothetical protein SFV1gp63 [Sulfolobus filamentous virus 1]|uniref:Uncharacterized protein n=1 Tax=Sulfolobus filamentous virus 1 TaxID=2304198 RepID=A0A346LUA2_SUFV1|nr:hypothetical protein HOT91_gp63 [Sulfolobus filamentous virus 1]AXQ00145.1 hypothetical protein SFV1gp63 [Sulfolobus filamentous virus 1]